MNLRDLTLRARALLVANRAGRGAAFIDNTLADLQYALRTFRRAPLATLTIVITVAIGLGLVAVLFTVMNVLLFRTDAVPDITEIYAVERPLQANSGLAKFTRERFAALRSDTNVFTEVYAAVNEINLRVDGRMMRGSLVSASFFRVVRVNPIIGRPLSAADDDPDRQRRQGAGAARYASEWSALE